jgi:hypothetical protein
MIWPLWGRVCRVARGVKAGAAVHLRMARKLIGTVQPVLSITFVGTIDEALYCRVESRDLVRRACGYSKYAAWSNTPEPRVEKHFEGVRITVCTPSVVSPIVGSATGFWSKPKKWRGLTNENAGQGSAQWDV